MSWYEAVAFTLWLHDNWRGAGILPPEQGLRLPSEAEWEKAARGGVRIPKSSIVSSAADQAAFELMGNPQERREYPWGEEFEPERANTKESGIGATTAVGCFPAGAGPYGCLDMSGNVWEWTLTEAGGDRVIRGGSFGGPAGWARSSFRYGLDPSDWYNDVGFRVVLPGS